MALFGSTFVAGILLGGIYAIIAVGMSLVMGVMKLVNLAHGALMMVAMYIALVLFESFGIHPYAALVPTMAILFGIGYLLQKYSIDMVYRKETILPESQLLLTLALALAITEIIRVIFTSDFQIIRPALTGETWHIGALIVEVPYVIGFFMAIAFIVGVHVFLTRTDLGRSLRAASQDRQAAIYMGVNDKRLINFSFGLGSALAAAGGIMLMPIFYLYPDVWHHYLMISFVIVILGGMGSLLGSLLGGFIIGLAEVFGATYWGPGWGMVTAFIIFLIILIFLPGGIKSVIGK